VTAGTFRPPEVVKEGAEDVMPEILRRRTWPVCVLAHQAPHPLRLPALRWKLVMVSRTFASEHKGSRHPSGNSVSGRPQPLV